MIFLLLKNVNLGLLLTNDFIYKNRCLCSTLVFFLLTAVYVGFEIPINICGGHHYQKRYIWTTWFMILQPNNAPEPDIYVSIF